MNNESLPRFRPTLIPQGRTTNRDELVDLEGEFEFDATAALLKCSAKYLRDEMRDRTEAAERLAEIAGVDRKVAGGYTVEVESAFGDFMEAFGFEPLSFWELTDEAWSYVKRRFKRQPKRTFTVEIERVIVQRKSVKVTAAHYEDAAAMARKRSRRRVIATYTT